MTGQFSDFVILDGAEHSVAGVSGSGLFDPGALGLEPRAISSACWRGFVCWYAIQDDVLTLTRLVLGSGTRVEGRTLRPEDDLMGRPLQAVARGIWEGCLEARDLLGVTQFSGGLLLGRDFVRDAYVHMGYQPAWRYETVHELLLEGGRVIEVIDRSAALGEIRERIRRGAIADPDGSRELTTWIERTFSLDYSRSGL